MHCDANVTKRIRIGILVCIGALWTSHAFAAPITLSFAGNWSYYNLGDTSPDHLALEAGFGNLGIYSGGQSSVANLTSGTPLTFSMTVNPNAPVNGTGQYAGALLGGRIRVGSLTYYIEPSNMSSGGWFFGPTRVHGPSVTANGITSVPVWAGFSSNVTGNPALPTAMANASSWTNSTMWLSFRPAGCSPWPCSEGDLVVSGLQLTSVSVPEVSSLYLAATGALCLGVFCRRRGGARLHSVKQVSGNTVDRALL